MSFVYPLGLLGLIGIPIVIIIYILRSKYNEQTVTSTYIWKLSEKFLKRKNPLSGLTGLISLILQILTIATVSLAVAKPIIVLPDAAYDYCFVLDASGSMNMKQGKKTRFELAKEEIEDIIRDAADGSTYSLISVSNEAFTVFEEVSNKSSALDALELLSASSDTHAHSDIFKTAQKRFDDNSSALLYLITDKSYAEYENIEVIDVGGKDVENYAIFDVTYSHSGGKLTVTANVIAYKDDADLDVNLYVDGEDTPSASKPVSVKAGELTSVTLECSKLKFNSFTTEVTNSDGYTVDNSVITHNLESDKTYDTLIVSETGFFIQSALDALLNVNVKIVDPDVYEEEIKTNTYGLYIFDSYTPAALPDGAVWLINSDKSIVNSGFSVRDKVELGKPAPIEKSSSTATDVRSLLQDVDGRDIYIDSYVKYSGMYLDFTTLFTYDSQPIIFAGANGLGNRQVVFGFDFHKSDFVLNVDFIMLFRNLIEYSFPDVLDKTNYIVGEEVLVNVLPNADTIKAYAPSGKEVYMESNGVFATLGLTEIGTYTINMKISGEETSYKLYSGANPEESKPNVEEQEFSISGERGYDKRDGEYDPTMVLFALLALLFIADWGVYCYEKYQLR